MKKKGFTLVEMLAVIVILGIVMGLGVAAYSKYVTSSRNKSYNIAENSLKTSAGDAIIDCLTGEGKNREFCKNHDLVENQYEYELVYLKELVNDDYMDQIRDPYNTDQLCSEDSYVYITNKADTNQVNNADLDYKVCLICSNYRSKDCLEDVENTNRNYNAYCKVTYSDGREYNGDNWTDQDLKLTLTVDSTGDYKYGISYFNYSYEGVSKKVQANNNQAEVILDSTVNSQTIMVTAVDGMNGLSKPISCDKIVKIDKEALISGKVAGMLATKKTEIKSNAWASEDVLLTVTTNPKVIPSGATYTWYQDGVKVAETTDNKYTAKTDGTYYAEVTNGVNNNTVKTNEFIVKIDRTKPTIAVKVNPLISTSQSYNFLDNVTSKFGVSGGTTTCSPSTSSKLGEYTVTCTAKGNNQLSTSVSFKAQIDNTKPTITAKNSSLGLGNGDYSFVNNVTSKFGVSGGTTTCNPANSKKTGNYTVTCTAIGNNGLSASVSFTAKHSYAASCWQEKGSCSDKSDDGCCQWSWDGGCSMTGGNCTPTQYCVRTAPGDGCCGSWSYNTKCNCPNGGSLSGRTCYY